MSDTAIPSIIAKCSKCERDLDASGFPRWCKVCRAKYQREWCALRKEMSETRGFAAGVSAFREHLLKKFSAIPASYMFSGPVAAEWVRTEPFNSTQE